MLKGYENENQKLMKKDRSLNEEVKDLNAKLHQQETQVKEYKLKALKEKSGVYVEADDDDVDIQAKNVMGSGQAISQKQLEELYQKLKAIQGQNDDAKRDLSIQANQFKAQIARIRDEKALAEK